jgi:exodeoxyribonuclease-3
MRIATWNVNSLRVRLPQLTTWLASNPVDVLAVQETKVTDEEFPHAEIEALGYNAVVSGQPSYNGVAILSKEEAKEVERGIGSFVDEQRRVIAATVGGIRVVNVYVPNGQALDSPKFPYKLSWLAALKAHVQSELEKYPRLVLLGDFNIAPEDIDVHDPKAWEGHIHVTAEERAALQEILGLGLVDLFRQFPQAEKSFSWWDYRMMAFRRNHGLRIDLVLASRATVELCDGCHVDKEPRKWERPSDHAPVIANFNTAT